MRHIGLAVAAALFVTLAGGGAPAHSLPEDRPAVRHAMRDVLAAGGAGVQVRVHDHRGVWTAVAGVARLGQPATVPAGGQFRIGSITKMFVATVVLQLVGEGRLGLDDVVGDHLPQFGLDRRITVRMVLGHRSGLFNYTETGDDITTMPPEGLVRVGLSKPAHFEPGAGWHYSNTNFVLAGLLVEKLTGLPYAASVYGRIIVPHGLVGTLLPGAFPEIVGPHAHSYMTVGGQRNLDITASSMTWAWAAGEILSTPADLDVFMAALSSGRLLRPDLLAQMRAFHPADANGSATAENRARVYGLATEAVDFTPACRAIGHDGYAMGFASYLYTTPSGGRRVVVSATAGGIEVAGLNNYRIAARAVAARALCDR